MWQFLIAFLRFDFRQTRVRSSRFSVLRARHERNV
jgi:hypothetical protein